jgi:multisubunit Na+/H+ antiporter MnhB subunit
MRPTTIVIQCACASIGLLFVLVGLGARGNAFVGGLVFGSMMFLFASLLGADCSTNADAKSRRVFKVLAVLFACPVLAIGIFSLYKSLTAAQWVDALTAALRLLVYALAVVGVAFDHHPIVRRAVERFGFSASKR